MAWCAHRPTRKRLPAPLPSFNPGAFKNQTSPPSTPANRPTGPRLAIDSREPEDRTGAGRGGATRGGRRREQESVQPRPTAAGVVTSPVPGAAPPRGHSHRTAGQWETGLGVLRPAPLPLKYGSP